MRELREKQKIKRRIYSLPVLAGLVLLLLIFAKGAWGALEKEKESRKYVDMLESKVDELESREEKLKVDLARLQTDEGIDEEIKAKYSVSKEGEHVAVIVEERSRSTTTEGQSKSFWQKILDIIGR